MNAQQQVVFAPQSVGTQQGTLPMATGVAHVFDPSTPNINAQMLADAAIRHSGRVAAEIAATEVRVAQAQAAALDSVRQAKQAEIAANTRAATI